VRVESGQSGFMSRLRRLVLSDRFFFITCRPLPHRGMLEEPEFECMARVLRERREKHHFLLTAWVFFPDHWHAIIFPRLTGQHLAWNGIAQGRFDSSHQGWQKRVVRTILEGKYAWKDSVGDKPCYNDWLQRVKSEIPVHTAVRW
jgi:REP element-mobilizing transposase RayT